MWQHNYTPVAGSIAWSALCAAIPMATLLYMLAIRRQPAWIAALTSLGAAILVAALVYQMPPIRIATATLYGVAFGLLPIGWITFNAIFLYRLTLETGQFEIIKDSLASVTQDRRLQALFIAFAFGSFIEGAAGSGVPVAVGAAMLAGLGFDRLKAAGLCLLANTAPVAFGAIGTPIIVLAKATDLPIAALSAATGRISAPLALIVPTYMVVVLAGWKGLRGALPAAIVCGVSFATVQVLVSSFIGPELTDILAALAALSSMMILLRFWQPPDQAGFSPAAATTAKLVRHPPRAILAAWLPYLLLAACVLTWGVPAFKSQLARADLLIAWPGLDGTITRLPPTVATPAAYPAIYKLDLLASPGTACLLASILAAAFAGLSPARFFGTFASALRQMGLPLVAITSVLGLAFLMNYSGATATLGLAFATTGVLFPFFSTLLGWMGVFLTGSDGSSNALFGNLQATAARQLDLNPILTASANSAGGVMGKMISVQSIAVAAAATGMKPGEESQLFRFTFWHSVALACALGGIVMLYAYVLPWIIPT